MIALKLLTLANGIRRAFETSAALRRDDYFRVLELNDGASYSRCPDCIYAWYRLGCYQRVVELTDDYVPKTSRDVAAISVSLAATGSFRKCEDLINRHLVTLRCQRQYALEAARGIVKFIPTLATRICQGVPNSGALKAAAHLALGQHEMARQAFSEIDRPRRADLLAGHFFLKANFAETEEERLAAVNLQLRAFGLSGIHLDSGRSRIFMNCFQNVPAQSRMSGPLVSIIVPAFNAEAQLQRSVRSLLDQTYQNLEIIIVDDGSVDATGRIARGYAASDARIRVFAFEQNRGAYAARNMALRKATGVFATVHDADDFAHCEKIERQVRPLLNDDRLVFSISDMVRVSAEGMFARREVYPLQRLNTSSLTFRRAVVLRECGYWEEERFGADSEYFFRLRVRYPKERWVRLRQPLTFAADHSSSLTSSVSTGGVGVPSDPRRTAYTEAYTQRWLESSTPLNDG